jgi:hypothetical protein
LRFGENPENCLNFSEWELFFTIFASGVSNLVEYAKKWCFFDVFIQGFFRGNARNVIFGIKQVQGLMNIE